MSSEKCFCTLMRNRVLGNLAGQNLLVTTTISIFTTVPRSKCDVTITELVVILNLLTVLLLLNPLFIVFLQLIWFLLFLSGYK